MGEAPDRIEEGDERADETLEDFRQQVRAESGDEGEDESPFEGGGAEGAEKEEPAPAGEGGRDETTANQSDEDLEGFRQQILEEEGPEQPGEDSPDSQPHEPAEGADDDVPTGRESAEAQEEARESHDGQEISGSKEETATSDSEEAPGQAEPDSTHGGPEEAAAVDPPDHDSPEPADKVEDNDLEPKDLEEFRERILDEYGPEGLGEDTPEGQLYDLAREEMEEGRGSSGPDEVDESDKAEGVADSADAPEAVADSFEATVADEVRKQAPDSPSQAEPDGQGADGGPVGESEAERTQDESESMKRVVEELGPEGPSGDISGERLDGLTGAESLDSHREGPLEEAGDAKRGDVREDQPPPPSPDDGTASEGPERRLSCETATDVVEAKGVEGAEPVEVRREPEVGDLQPLPKLGEPGAAANQPEEPRTEIGSSSPVYEEIPSAEAETDRLVVPSRTVEPGPANSLQEANDPANLPGPRGDAGVVAAHAEAESFEPAAPSWTPPENAQIPVQSGSLESVAVQAGGPNGGERPGLWGDVPPSHIGGDFVSRETGAMGGGHPDRYDNQSVVAEQEAGHKRPETTPEPAVGARGLDSRADFEQHAYEARVLEVVDYGKGAVLRVPKTDLGRAGFEPDGERKPQIVEMLLRNEEDGSVDRVFARYSPSDRRAEAYVRGIGGEKGDRYRVLEAREYGEDRLVKDFEKFRCEHLQNVALEHVDGKMLLNVDGRKVEMKDYRIATAGSDVVMQGKLDSTSPCKVEFDGRKATVKFGRDYHVEGIRVEEDVLVVSYSQSRNERHEHRFYLDHSERLDTPSRPSLDQFGKSEMKERVMLLSRPEKIEGEYEFVLNEDVRQEIKRLLDAAKKQGDKTYGATKAEISERLAPNLLDTLGWERLERHPFSKKSKESAAANDTDWLMLDPDGKKVLMEIKWYENKRDAIRKASTQVERDFLEHQDDPDLNLKGAYIAIVDYDPDNKHDQPFRVHVLRVRSMEELR